MPSLVHFLHAASQDRKDLALEDFSERQIRWVIEAGLGPLLLRHVADGPRTRTAPTWPLLKGADLTARLTTAERLDAMEEILRACDRRIRPPTLLKGISVGGQFYPEPHLRPMSDIDFLVATRDLAPVEAALFDLGYRQESTHPREFYETHHHTTPFRHPRTGVWVEVHRGLCARSSPVGSDAPFGAERVLAEQSASEFRGHAVYRLSEELQIVYLAAHWAYDFRLAGGLVAMLDTIHLLKNARPIRWERLLELLEGTVAATAVYLVLAYLDRHELLDLPSGLIGEIAHRQRALGRPSLWLLHGIIDRYVTNGRDLGLLMSERNLPIIWESLLRPCPGFRKPLLAGWKLLPSRSWLMRSVPSPAPRSSAPDAARRGSESSASGGRDDDGDSSARADRTVPNRSGRRLRQQADSK